MWHFCFSAFDSVAILVGEIVKLLRKLGHETAPTAVFIYIYFMADSLYPSLPSHPLTFPNFLSET